MTKTAPLIFTSEQLDIIKSLSESQLKEIDAMLISETAKSNRKVARIVGYTMMKLPNWSHGIPDIFYGQRVKKLVKEGRLIVEGDLAYMRYSEVRLP